MTFGAVSKSRFKQSVRYINGLTIFFKSKETIYATDGKVSVIFERWFDKDSGFYRHNWFPFCDALRRNDGLESMYDLYRLASRYDISVVDHQKEIIVPAGIKVYPARCNRAKRRRKNAKAKNN